MQKLFSIGEVAEILDISKPTLRYYEQSGLIQATKDDTNGYRFYTIEQIFTLMDIKFYRQLGIPVKEIARMIHAMDLAQVTEVLHQTLQQVEQQIQRYQEMAEQLARRESLCWEAQENLGIFSVTADTGFPYLVLCPTEDWENAYDPFGQTDYCVYLPAEKWAATFDLRQMLTGYCTESLEDPGPQDTVIPLSNGGPYLTVVIRSDNQGSECQYQRKIRAWLQEHGKSPAGGCIGRYLCSSYETKPPLDYYRIWLPIADTDENGSEARKEYVG